MGVLRPEGPWTLSRPRPLPSMAAAGAVNYPMLSEGWALCTEAHSPCPWVCLHPTVQSNGQDARIHRALHLGIRERHRQLTPCPPHANELHVLPPWNQPTPSRQDNGLRTVLGGASWRSAQGQPRYHPRNGARRRGNSNLLAKILTDWQGPGCPMPPFAHGALVDPMPQHVRLCPCLLQRAVCHLPRTVARDVEPLGQFRVTASHCSLRARERSVGA